MMPARTDYPTAWEIVRALATMAEDNEMTDTFTAKEKLEAVERELHYRVRVYARRVADGKMTQAFADRQIAIFRAILHDYSTIARKEQLL